MKPAPYPPDTRAKGWRFELDLERVRQSDTWALATPELRPWLLMLWSEAWMQTPCGSLPNDDALIAARIGMQPKALAKGREVLLRGWWQADDGRLYHPVITEMVAAMLKRKDAERQRKAEYRARMDAERRGGPASVPRDSGGSDDTGTGTGTRKEGSGAKAPTPSAGASPAASVCIALRQCGMADVNPSHPRLLALLEAGAEEGEFTAFAKRSLEVAPGNAFAYLLATVEGERQRAKAAAPSLHRGPMPNRQEALEQRNQAVGERWLAKGVTG